MKSFYTLAIIFCIFHSSAQTALFKGTIIDATTKKGIEFGTITLKNLNDFAQLKGGKSKDQGKFDIPNIPFGTYEVSFTSIGYSSYTMKSLIIDQPLVDVKKIEINADKTNLKDVTITAEKATVELGIDKKTFNVDKNITSAGGTAADILRNIPSVNVDLDGNLSLRGKENITLLVDGKPSSMFGNDPQTALNLIPAASIESVEVINNPSSKFEAQGMNGIINIILRKDRKPGYNATINLGAAAPFRLNAGLNLNANIKKWNVFFNGNTRTSRTWEETQSIRKNYEDPSQFTSYTHNDRRPLNGFLNIGADFSPNKKNKFTISQNIFNANMKGNSQTTLRNIENEQILNTQFRSNQYTGKPLSYTTNLQYKHIFKDPKEDINIELNYSKTRYIRESNIFTNWYDSSSNLSNSFIQRNPIRGGNWNGTFQVDYTKPIFKHGRIDIGERTYYINFESENQPTIQFTNQTEIPETILKNHFVFNQQVHGLYTNLANQFGKTGVQIGLRGEFFGYQGTVYQYNLKTTDQYFSLFPTFFVNHKLTSTSEFNFNYAKRVNRPNFFQLVPYLDVTNPQDTSQGNPQLKPEFIHAFELTYSHQYGKNNTLIASVYYQHTNNLIQRFRRFNPNGTTYSQNRNLATGITSGIDITNKMNLLPWIDATLNVNIFKNDINGGNVDASLQRKGFGGFAKLIGNMKLPKGFNTQITANYFGTTSISQGVVNPYGNFDFAIKKSFFKNLASLTLNVNDLFNTIQTETVYDFFPLYDQTVLRKNQTRSVGLNLQIKLANKSQRNSADLPKKQPSKKEKEKETKNRDENLKKDDGNEEGGGSQNNK